MTDAFLLPHPETPWSMAFFDLNLPPVDGADELGDGRPRGQPGDLNRGHGGSAGGGGAAFRRDGPGLHRVDRAGRFWTAGAGGKEVPRGVAGLPRLGGRGSFDRSRRSPPSTSRGAGDHGRLGLAGRALAAVRDVASSSGAGLHGHGVFALRAGPGCDDHAVEDAAAGGNKGRGAADGQDTDEDDHGHDNGIERSRFATS